MNSPDLAAVCDDLAAEHADLDRIVARLDAAQWEAPTPAEPWAVRDQVGHLAFFDGEARRALVDPAGFTAGLAEIAGDVDGYMAHSLEVGRAKAPVDLLAWWRDERARLLDAARAADPAVRVPWYGPPMSVMSFVTARLMETWVHGQDVVDGLGLEREPTARLRHVAHIAVRARPFNYRQRGRELPDREVRVELTAPDGATWAWGPEDAEDRVRGDAFDFCLVTTQRRHLDDTGLEVQGDLAREWMLIAQAFAGPPGPGRRPGQFPRRSATA